MIVYRDFPLSKWFVAALLVAAAQVAIAPRAAHAECGDYVILGGHAADAHGADAHGAHANGTHLHGVILPATRNETFHTNPKRQRGNALTPSLALRVSVTSDRGQHNANG